MTISRRTHLIRKLAKSKNDAAIRLLRNLIDTNAGIRAGLMSEKKRVHTSRVNLAKASLRPEPKMPDGLKKTIKSAFGSVAVRKSIARHRRKFTGQSISN